MYIPDKMLPKVVVVGGSPRLPPENNKWIKDAAPETKAEKYFIEGLRKLALARYWVNEAEKTDEPEEKEPVW